MRYDSGLLLFGTLLNSGLISGISSHSACSRHDGYRSIGTFASFKLKSVPSISSLIWPRDHNRSKFSCVRHPLSVLITPSTLFFAMTTSICFPCWYLLKPSVLDKITFNTIKLKTNRKSQIDLCSEMLSL